MKKNRNCQSGWWVVLLTATLAVPSMTEGGVGLFNSKLKQVTTSSTLRWVNPRKEAQSNYVVGSESDKGPIYLCRARHQGDMILGQLKPDYTSCLVSGSKHDVFEVLENIENASLIEWQPWFKFNSKPNGAVVVDSSFDSVFIGRLKKPSDNSHNIVGKIGYESNIGEFKGFDDEINDIITDDNGEILVEIEPVGYKLENVVLDMSTEHVIQSDPEILDERVLKNDEEAGATVTTEISYSYDYTLSWGHGHGIAIGLNTSVEMADGTLLPQIQWANPFTEKRTILYKLEQFLEPGTACNVTFRGNTTDRDVQYTAKLVTFYRGKDTRSRQMRGQRIENIMEVEAVYGEIYFVGNNSFVPTTTTTTSTTTTTTTTPAPETVPPAPEENDIASPIKKADSSHEMDTGDMMGDSSEEMVKEPQAKEDNINRAVVGGLGSNPNGAGTTTFTIALLVPILALLF